MIRAEAPVVTWLDPGKTTGGATYDCATGEFASWQHEDDGYVEELDRLIVRYGTRLAVGYEMYIVTAAGPRSGTPKYSQGVISNVRDMAQHGMFSLLKPVPSSARFLGGPVLLRRLGWHKPGKVHANDAAMHTLAYLLRTPPIPANIRKLFTGYEFGCYDQRPSG